MKTVKRIRKGQAEIHIITLTKQKENDNLIYRANNNIKKDLRIKIKKMLGSDGHF